MDPADLFEEERYDLSSLVSWNREWKRAPSREYKETALKSACRENHGYGIPFLMGSKTF